MRPSSHVGRMFSDPALSGRVAAQRVIVMYEQFQLRFTATTDQSLCSLDNYVWPKLVDFATTLQFAHLTICRL